MAHRAGTHFRCVTTRGERQWGAVSLNVTFRSKVISLHSTADKICGLGHSGNVYLKSIPSCTNIGRQRNILNINTLTYDILFHVLLVRSVTM